MVFRKKLDCQVKARLSGSGRAVRSRLGCRVKVRLSLDCEAVCLSRWTPGALINLAPQPGLLPSSHSSEGILAEWILRPGQFQGNPGALGPDGGDGTSKVTMRAGQAPPTWPHWTLGHFLPGPRIFGKMVFWMMNFIKSKFVWGLGPLPLVSALGQGGLAMGASGPFGNQKPALVLSPENYRHSNLNSTSGGSQAGPLWYTIAGGRLNCLNAFRAEQLTPQRCSHHLFGQL